MTKSRAWTYVGIVAGLTTAVIVADVKFNSQASEQIVVQRAYDSTAAGHDQDKPDLRLGCLDQHVRIGSGARR